MTHETDGTSQEDWEALSEPVQELQEPKVIRVLVTLTNPMKARQ